MLHSLQCWLSFKTLYPLLLKEDITAPLSFSKACHMPQRARGALLQRDLTFEETK